MRIAPEHPNKLARIGACLTVMGSLIWVQWPINLQDFNFAAGILLLASFVSWVSMELADLSSDDTGVDNTTNDDVRKMNALLKIVDRRQAYILREHAIETYMDDSDYDGLRDLQYYRSDDIFPFHNGKIQIAYENFCKDADSFLHHLYNLYTSDGRGRITWRTRDERWLPEDQYNQVMEKIAHLNRQTSTLSKSWEALVALARQELKDAPMRIDPYEQ